jgi:hypothetical protein
MGLSRGSDRVKLLYFVVTLSCNLLLLPVENLTARPDLIGAGQHSIDINGFY